MISSETRREVDDVLQGASFSDSALEQRMRSELATRLEEARTTGQPLRVFAGYDASRPNLHLGHTITLRKLRIFQDLGHEVVFLVGTLTAQVGDPSDRLYGRPRISPEDVGEAARTFIEQIGLVLDLERTEVRYNGDWLARLELPDVLAFASAFTLQQVTAQAFIRRRLAKSQPVGLHELFYGLMQAYDAVHLRADVQLGTVGPLFNMLAGRRLQAIREQRPCVVVTYPVLWGTRGHNRMSKREGTALALTEPPDDQFGKVMSIDDETMRQWVELVASWSPAEARAKLAGVDSGALHPMALKKELAHDIVATYHGPEAATAALGAFERHHQLHRPSPDDARPLPLQDATGLVDALVVLPRVRSRSEARRMVASGAVRVNGTVVSDVHTILRHGDLLQVGKREVRRIEGTSPDGDRLLR